MQLRLKEEGCRWQGAALADRCARREKKGERGQKSGTTGLVVVVLGNTPHLPCTYIPLRSLLPGRGTQGKCERKVSCVVEGVGVGKGERRGAAPHSFAARPLAANACRRQKHGPSPRRARTGRGNPIGHIGYPAIYPVCRSIRMFVAVSVRFGNWAKGGDRCTQCTGTLLHRGAEQAL